MAVSADLFSGLGSAVGDIFGGAAAFSTASGYKSAADAYMGSSKLYQEQAGLYDQMGVLSGQSAGIAGVSDRLTQLQTQRGITKVLGGQRSDIGAANLMESGSALDVIRDSTQQGHLQMAVARANGQLEQQGYKEEALSYQAQGKASLAASAAAVGQAGQAQAAAAASKKSGIGGILGGILKIGATVAPLIAASDYRLKRNITFLDRREDGLAHYIFQYRDSPEVYIGVMAQEVLELYPDAVMKDPNSGYYMVNYTAINDTMYLVGHA